jgi:pimeloyl-[acyl-carrier protein] synthase
MPTGNGARVDEHEIDDVGALDLDRTDPFDARFRSDPYPLLARFRAERPVHQFVSGQWWLTRHADVAMVLRDRRFGSDPALLAAPFRERAGDSIAFQSGSGALLWMDPPDHTRLRGLVAQPFTPRALAAWRPRVDAICTGLVDDLVAAVADAGSADLLTTLAYPLPVDVISEILGIPPVDREQVRTWSSAASRMLDGGLDAADQAAGLAGTMELFALFTGLVEERRQAPHAEDDQGDLLDALLAAEQDGDRLTSDELVTTVVTLFVAGHETTMHLIGNGVLALLDHPAQLARLQADPSLASRAVDEALRFVGPPQVASRIATEPVAIDGHVVDTGEPVIVSIAAADRDPDRFPDPDVFDLDRDASGHLAFSSGIHHCLGAALARMEAEAAFTAVATRLPDLALVGGRPTFRAHAVLRGLEALPVTFTPTGR